MPLVARDVYGMTEIGLGFLLATFAGGALVGSLLIATALRAVQGERLMLSCFIGFHAVMIWFALNEDPSPRVRLAGSDGSALQLRYGPNVFGLAHRDTRGVSCPGHGIAAARGDWAFLWAC